MGEAKILLFAKLNYSTNSQPINMSVPPQGGQPMLTPWGRIAKYQTYPFGKLIQSSPLSKYLLIAGALVALPMFNKLYNICNSPAALEGWKERRKEYYEPHHVKW